MKLTEQRPNLETSGNLKEQFFSIQDQGMIFDILRNKMYSDPILAICREISCNARDAHIEVGKNNVPIEITLPNGLEPFYKIKDWGPGISPDRMSNIFIKYTASTKRNDNLQTGGFGLGAKTPFSYSDTFTITTVHNKIKYNYACFIDETKVGKLILMGDESVEEENSTEIVIPIKRDDFNKFVIATEQSTRHWKIKPIIKGTNLAWTQYNFSLEGTGWKIGATKSVNSSYSYNDPVKYERGVKILVEGVEYNVSMEALRKFTSTKIIDACKGYLFLYFNIGELTLSANRESIYIDKSTEDKITKRLDVVTSEIIKVVNNKISSFSSYHEANKYFYTELKSTFNNLNFLGDLNWNNIKLYGPDIDVYSAAIVTEFFKTRTRRGKDPDKIRFKSKASHILRLDPEISLFYNDLKIENLTYKHVKQAFEDGAKVVQVMEPCSDNFSVLEQKYNLTGIGCKMLSTITSATPAQNKVITANKLLVFKLYPSYYGPKYEQIAFSEIKDDKSKTKVLCFFERSDNVYGKQHKNICLNGTKSNYGDKLSSIFQIFKDEASFYSIQKDTDPARIKKDFDGFVLLDDFINEKIVKSNMDFVGIKAVSNYFNYSYYNDSNYKNQKTDDLLNIIDDKSVYAKRAIANKKILSLKEKHYIIPLYEQLCSVITDKQIKDWWNAHPELDYKKIQDECNKKYPLLSYNIEHVVSIEHIAQYINFIDSL